MNRKKSIIIIVLVVIITIFIFIWGNLLTASGGSLGEMSSKDQISKQEIGNGWLEREHESKFKYLIKKADLTLHGTVDQGSIEIEWFLDDVFGVHTESLYKCSFSAGDIIDITESFEGFDSKAGYMIVLREKEGSVYQLTYEISTYTTNFKHMQKQTK